MIIVTGYVRLDPNDVREFARDMEALARVTQARDGCGDVLKYDATNERSLMAE